jgi:3-methyladenine DNA glycosylase AlkD
MNSNLKQIQHALRANSSEENKVFFHKMVPGQQKTYGVKTPILNDLVRRYQHGGFELAEDLWQSGAFEEKIIAIKIIEKTGKTDPERVLRIFKRFSKQIDNWAVCDGLGMQLLRGIVKTHRGKIFEIAKKFNRSRDPWQRRLSLVMVEWYTRDREAHQEIKALVKNLEKDQEYYVQKAVGWIKRNFQKGK